MADIEVRRLLEADLREGFECGDASVDRFFRDHVAINEFHHQACATYVVSDGIRVVSFVTVVPASIDPRSLGRERRGLPGYPQPVLKLAQFGTDLRAQGRGYATRLMFQVFSCARALARDYGCVGVVLDAVPTAVGYYRRFDFVTLAEPTTPDGTSLMFLQRRKIPGV